MKHMHVLFVVQPEACLCVDDRVLRAVDGAGDSSHSERRSQESHASQSTLIALNRQRIFGVSPREDRQLGCQLSMTKLFQRFERLSRASVPCSAIVQCACSVRPLHAQRNRAQRE